MLRKAQNSPRNGKTQGIPILHFNAVIILFEKKIVFEEE